MEWLAKLNYIRRAMRAVVAYPIGRGMRNGIYDRRRNPQTPHDQDEFNVVIYWAGTFRKGKQTLSF